MRALVSRGAWQLDLEEWPEPSPPIGREAVIEIEASGICGTDLGIISGQYAAASPVVLGHESAGRVVAIGRDAAGVAIGDRVVIDPTFFCGTCRMCRTNRENHCERKLGTEAGVSRDGTFARFYKTEERFLHKLPPNVTPEVAALSEPLSCVLTGVSRLTLRPDLRVVIVGGGPIGMLYAWMLALSGVKGCLVEISADRRRLCESLVGANWRVVPSLDEAFPGEEVDIVVDAAGVALAASLPRLARGGQFLAVGLRHAPTLVDAGIIADRSWALLGSIDSLQNSFAAAVSLLISGTLPAARLVTHVMPLSEYRAALSLLGCALDQRSAAPRAAAGKILLCP